MTRLGRRARRATLGVAAGLAVALSLGVALGAPTGPDLGFGEDGRVTIGAGGNEYGQALAVQPDRRGRLHLA